MYRCDNCGAEFDHSVTVTEPRPLGEESYQICPMCRMTGRFEEITDGDTEEDEEI